jgi:flavodoxin
MKSLVVYSSRTGNTAKVARAVFEALPEPRDIYPVEEAPAVDGYDFVAIGFWVDKGRPDEKAAGYMGTIRDANLALFGTLGADPTSDHALSCLRQAIDLVSGNQIIGTFLCQGRIDPAVVEAMRRTASDVHPMTPERMARIKAAETHPDQADLSNAQLGFRKMIGAGLTSKEPPCGK